MKIIKITYVYIIYKELGNTIWRLRNPRSRDSGELMFQFKSKGLRSKRTNGINSSTSPNPKAGEDKCSCSKSGREEVRILPYSAFCSIQDIKDHC